MNKEESFEEWLNVVFQTGSLIDREIYSVAHKAWNYQRAKYEKLLAEKDKQLEEAREMFRDFQKQTVPNVDWIYEMDATINEWLEQLKGELKMDMKREKQILNEMCGRGYIPTSDVLKEIESQSETIRQIILNLYELIPKETNPVENQTKKPQYIYKAIFRVRLAENCSIRRFMARMDMCAMGYCDEVDSYVEREAARGKQLRDTVDSVMEKREKGGE